MAVATTSVLDRDFRRKQHAFALKLIKITFMNFDNATENDLHHLQRVKRDSEHQIQKLNEQRALIAQLEQDLSSVRSFATTSLYGGETEAALLSSDLVSGISTTPVPSSHGSSPAFGTSASPSATDTLLPIVQAQRERFKQINFELETLTQQQQQQISLLQSELEGVRSDNVKLYEKIRFLQSYPNRAAAAGPLAEGSTEQRYQSQYEAHLDPFSSFSRKERQRRYTQLSTFDKITLSMGQFFLSSPLARMITLLYFFMLHCLVFLALYQVAHTESCHRDMASECAERFAQHMQKVHGENVE